MFFFWTAFHISLNIPAEKLKREGILCLIPEYSSYKNKRKGSYATIYKPTGSCV